VIIFGDSVGIESLSFGESSCWISSTTGLTSDADANTFF